MSETEATPLRAEEKTDKTKETETAWQDFLQKCCEAGQIEYQLSRLESQKLEIEKQLEVTQRAVKAAARKYDELRANFRPTMTAPTVKQETTETVGEAH